MERLERVEAKALPKKGEEVGKVDRAEAVAAKASTSQVRTQPSPPLLLLRQEQGPPQLRSRMLNSLSQQQPPKPRNRPQQPQLHPQPRPPLYPQLLPQPQPQLPLLPSLQLPRLPQQPPHQQPQRPQPQQPQQPQQPPNERPQLSQPQLL